MKGAVNLALMHASFLTAGVSGSKRNIFRLELSEEEAEWGVAPTSPGPHVRVYRIEQSDLGSTDSREVREFNQAFGQFVRLLKGRRVTVTTVDCLCYDAASSALQRFHAKKEEFAVLGVDLAEQWVFHGSDDDGIEGIVKDGFLVGGVDPGVKKANGDVYGSGVYSATGPSTPMYYGRGSHKVGRDCMSVARVCVCVHAVRSAR